MLTLREQIETLVNEVSGIGEGDLRIQAEVTTDELGVLADSFNYMAEELGTLVITVKSLSRQVQDSTAQTFEHMVQMVDNAETEIQQITMAKNEVANLSLASRRVAERAQVLSDAAAEVRQNASTGRSALSQTFNGIERINKNVRSTASRVNNLGERSREINELVKVISSIAHQTNRLALDAAIQAAMAGENGKGFGAVAVDIRRLAERAKEQTTTITQIVNSFFEDITVTTQSIKEAENETEVGSHLVQEAGIAFQSMFSMVEQQSNEIETINHVATQQLYSSDAIVKIMESVSGLTQKGSIVTHNAAREMEMLAQLATRLQSSVEVFKLPEEREQASRVAVTEMPPTSDDFSFNRPVPALPPPAMATPMPASNQASRQNTPPPPFPQYPEPPLAPAALSGFALRQNPQGNFFAQAPEKEVPQQDFPFQQNFPMGRS